MKKLYCFITFILLFAITSCSSPKQNELINAENTITDSLGNTCTLPDNPKVASCYGSFSECWLLSGGSLVGVTDDAINERHLDVDENTANIGTVKEINSEILISLSPDYVLLSNEIAAHKQLASVLKDANIDFGFFNLDTFDDYDNLMAQFCKLNNRDDLYKENVKDVKDNIALILSNVPDKSDKTYLVMRAYSTGIKVKTDNIADNILKDFNLVSITDKNPSLLTDLSVEYIVSEDPDYIFVLTMGDENNAYNYLHENIENNPAWNNLKAVRNNNYIILPKDLFHYKPNNRWSKSYEYIAKIIYPEIFGEQQ